MNVVELEEIAREIRKDIVTMAYKACAPSHPAPALSAADIVTALYFGIMNIKPEQPQWEDRDRFILSKGHACPVLYAALARKGYFPIEDLLTLRQLGGHLQGHPDMNKTPGVDMTSGSLGNGLSAGIGMALYAKAKRKRFQVYVMVGDGELQEGVIWEAILQAGNYRLDNLVCIVDYNHFQSCGCVDDIMPLHPLEDKWRAFGWEVLSANGHNMADVCNKLAIAAMFLGKPVVIVAHTVKGKGVSYMEQNNDWHQKRPTESEYDQAMRELGEVKAYA